MSNDAVAAMKAAREVLGIGLKSAESPPFIEKTENAIRKLDAAIKAAEWTPHGVKREDVCVWNQDSDGAWNTSCGKIFEFSNEGPKENSANFCYHCGGSLLPEPYSEDESPAQPSPEPARGLTLPFLKSFNEYMCPNCVTPWKCNGPHIPEPASEPQGAQISDEKRCPFCNEGEFDSIGLKGHLQQEDCEEYTNLTAPPRPFALLREAPAGWRPIESAPKDGRSLILLLTPSRFPQVAYSNTWWTSGFSVENKPTHWMPLPAAPKEGA